MLPRFHEKFEASNKFHPWLSGVIYFPKEQKGTRKLLRCLRSCLLSLKLLWEKCLQYRFSRRFFISPIHSVSCFLHNLIIGRVERR